MAVGDSAAMIAKPGAEQQQVSFGSFKMTSSGRFVLSSDRPIVDCVIHSLFKYEKELNVDARRVAALASIAFAERSLRNFEKSFDTKAPHMALEAARACLREPNETNREKAVKAAEEAESSKNRGRMKWSFWQELRREENLTIWFSAALAADAAAEAARAAAALDAKSARDAARKAASWSANSLGAPHRTSSPGWSAVEENEERWQSEYIEKLIWEESRPKGEERSLLRQSADILFGYFRH